MTLSTTIKQQLKSQAHTLKPIVIIGSKGLTQNIIDETNQSLIAHELIKIRVNAADRESRMQIANEICQQCGAELIQFIGHIAIIYRKNQD